MKTHIALFMIIFLAPVLGQAQNLSDAFRFSNNQIQGTARSAGIGNAMGALGGDFTSLSINPAGSAIYRSGEFVITPVYNFNNSEISLGSNKFSDKHTYMNLSNIGVVGSFHVGSNNSGLVSVNYGIGFNRLANFNSNSLVSNNGSTVSYLDDLANYSTGEKLNNSYLNDDFNQVEYRDWPAKLAWETFLINPAIDNQGNEIDNNYVSILKEGEKVGQNKTYLVEGGINEYLLNFGLNFNHNFYVGTTIGIQDLNYRSISMYKENFEQGGSFYFKDKYTVSGAGVNIKVGAIYKPVNMLRLGLAFHSPTYYQIDEESDLEMESDLDKKTNSYGVNNYNYEFYNPTKVILSGAIVFNKVGLLSADLEYQNYSKMKFRKGGDGSEGFPDLNSEINNEIKNIFNFRAGGEVKITDKFSGRLGFELYGNPYKNSVENDSYLTNGMMNGSVGFGYAVNNFSLNAAYRQSLMKTSQSNVQPNFYQLRQKDNNGQVMLSFGFRF
jgi:hypothetical protein